MGLSGKNSQTQILYRKACKYENDTFKTELVLKIKAKKDLRAHARAEIARVRRMCLGDGVHLQFHIPIP